MFEDQEMYEDEFDELEFEDEYEDEDEFEFEDEDEGEYESELESETEMELAAELLTVTNEAELDQFLGKIFRKVGKFAKRALRSPVGRFLKRGLKSVARRALPIAGRALGGFFGGPAGSAIGGKLGSFASRLFEFEFEGMSPEDQEFEIARRIVRLSAAAAKKAGKASPRANPKAVAKAAIISAAKKHAPGLVKGAAGKKEFGFGAGRGGRWIRRGRKIILLGA